jgi:hypothetical protein
VADPVAIADAVAALVASSLAQLGGRVAADEAAQAAGGTLPRAVVVDLGGSAAYDATGPVDESEVQVTLFAAGRAAARSLGRAARAACTDGAAPLDAAAGTLLYLRPTGPPVVTLDPAKGPGGIDVWRADLTLRAIVMEIDP